MVRAAGTRSRAGDGDGPLSLGRCSTYWVRNESHSASPAVASRITNESGGATGHTKGATAIAAAIETSSTRCVRGPIQRPIERAPPEKAAGRATQDPAAARTSAPLVACTAWVIKTTPSRYSMARCAQSATRVRSAFGATLSPGRRGMGTGLPIERRVLLRVGVLGTRAFVDTFFELVLGGSQRPCELRNLRCAEHERDDRDDQE